MSQAAELRIVETKPEASPSWHPLARGDPLLLCFFSDTHPLLWAGQQVLGWKNKALATRNESVLTGHRGGPHAGFAGGGFERQTFAQELVFKVVRNIL